MPKLYPFQEAAVEQLCSHSRYLLGSYMGLGKTATAIVAANRLLNADRQWKVLAIVPASIRLTWEAELKIWSPKSKVTVLTDGKKPIDHSATWIVCSYEYVVLHGSKLASIADDLLVIICDEAHMLKSPRAQRTKAILGKDGCARNINYVWLMTGTPFPNQITDCYIPFNFCAKGALGKYWKFAQKYAGAIKKTQWGLKPVGVNRRTLPELVEQVRPYMHRDSIETVLPELPAFGETNIYLEPTKNSILINRQLTHYEGMITLAIAGGKSVKVDNNLARLRREIGVEKVPQAVAFCKELEEQEIPFVVFAHHREVVEGIAKGLGAPSRMACQMIYGGISQNERDKLKNDFQAGKLPWLVLSIQAAGIGLTLHRASVAVFVEVDWTPLSLLQAMARIRRIGQKNYCNYYYLNFANSLDLQILHQLQIKAQGIDSFWEEWEGGETVPVAVEDDDPFNTPIEGGGSW